SDLSPFWAMCLSVVRAYWSERFRRRPRRSDLAHSPSGGGMAKTVVMHDISEEPGTVICVCGSEGFPRGFGGTARITLIGKSLHAAGLKFHVLHCGPSPLPENTQKSGI